MNYLLLTATICGLGSCTAQQSSADVSADRVQTENGIISGIKGNDPDVLVFKGIPYAAPPAGELRWKEPQPVEKWDDVRRCETFGPNAMQKMPEPRDQYTSEFFISADAPMSEDCLYLNVWTAARSRKERRPVIVYIHGGGFVENAGSISMFDGESMAGKGVVFVTLNYRLGIFGFFAHPELTAESVRRASGNYGILDQIAALGWVKNNIETFGGDPENVTIAGQSAGALSVNALSVSPLARGLFDRIIAESGACVLASSFGGTNELSQAEASGLNLMAKAGLHSLRELRNTPARELQKLMPRGIGLVVDGYVLAEPVPETYSKGKQANVPLLTGWNADEIYSDTTVTLEQYRAEITDRFGAEAETVLGLYPAATDSEATVARRKLYSELRFGIQNYAWARMQSELENAKAYLYYFNRKMPAVGEMKKYGAFHTAEIPYAYDNLSKLDRPWEPADHELARTMSACWVNFATNGDPNGNGLPSWPLFRADQGLTMIFDTTSEASEHLYHDALEVFYRQNKPGN
ncbi:MAG: carboxylesterase family protein [Tannerella sp.]|nr:carboxylesterase family protein [Tannerella sp.]